ncbi:MAG: hypothetical protein LBP65_02125 [Puniceicoccales bacterium]|nr:hypothetical protein [Puniceicoccales bacterium]
MDEVGSKQISSLAGSREAVQAAAPELASTSTATAEDLPIGEQPNVSYLSAADSTAASFIEKVPGNGSGENGPDDAVNRELEKAIDVKIWQDEGVRNDVLEGKLILPA